MKRLSSIFALFLFLSSQGFANVVGVDAQNFNPTADGLDFVTVQSGKTLSSGILNIGLFLNYSVNTLSFLNEADPSALQNKVKLNDKILSSDLNIALGLTDFWEIGLSLPYLLKQEIENSNQVAYFSSSGLTEVRLMTKFQFYSSEQTQMAVVGSMNNNNITNNPYTGSSPGPTGNLEFAWSQAVGESWVGFNFGHRFRRSGASLASSFGFDPLPNQWIYSAAYSRWIANLDTKIIFEIFGSAPSEQKNDLNLTNRTRSNLEALAGLKFETSKDLAWHAGLGTELQQGLGSPDYRIYLGLNWATGPVWKNSEPVVEHTPSPPNQKVYVLTNLRFKFDSAELTEWSMSQVQKVVTQVQRLKNLKSIVVDGHTDSIGKAEYNQKLSSRRAEAILKILSQRIPFDEKQMSSNGFGKTKPVADNSNFQGRALNRRVVITAKFTEQSDQQMTK